MLIYHGYINAFLDNMWQHMNYIVCALTKHLRNSDVNVKILNKTDICTVLLLSGKKYTIVPSLLIFISALPSLKEYTRLIILLPL